MPISPADAVVALRSYPRRFREIREAAETSDEAASVDAAAAAAAREIARVAEWLPRVFAVDQPTLSGSGSRDSLDEVAPRLADIVAEHHGSEWSRTGVGPSGSVTALDLLQEAVDAGAAQLRAVRPD